MMMMVTTMSGIAKLQLFLTMMMQCALSRTDAVGELSYSCYFNDEMAAAVLCSNVLQCAVLVRVNASV